MLHALLDREVKPDLIVGTSVGALHGALVEAAPQADVRPGRAHGARGARIVPAAAHTAAASRGPNPSARARRVPATGPGATATRGRLASTTRRRRSTTAIDQHAPACSEPLYRPHRPRVRRDPPGPAARRADLGRARRRESVVNVGAGTGSVRAVGPRATLTLRHWSERRAAARARSCRVHASAGRDRAASTRLLGTSKGSCETTCRKSRSGRSSSSVVTSSRVRRTSGTATCAGRRSGMSAFGSSRPNWARPERPRPRDSPW